MAEDSTPTPVEENEQLQANPAGPEPPSTSGENIPSTEKTGHIDPHDAQKRSRSENQDFLRILNMYGGQIPQVYVDHITVAQDMVLGTGRPTGDVVPPPERDSAEISRREIQKIVQVYERPVAYAQALQILQEDRCVALVGKPQCGKRAMAIHLALDVRTPSDAPIYELSPEENPYLQVKALPLPPGAVYIVDGLLFEQTRALKPVNVRDLLNTLEQRQSYLVITTQTGATFPAGLRVVRIAPPELPATLLVEKHLSYYGAFSPAQITEAFAIPALVKLLEKELSPSQADQLAARLAQSLLSNVPVEEALRGFSEAMTDAVHKWFNDVADDVEAAAFRIALAVFNGAQVTEVQQAAQTLVRLLRPPTNDTQPPTPPSTFVSPFKKETLAKKLEKAGAKLVERPVVREYSDKALVKVVELEDESYSNVLLAYIWEYDELRPIILEWLCEYATNAPLDMRLRAAGALGALASMDFEVLTRRVFLKWANVDIEDADLRRRHHQALGNALGVLIWNEAHAEEVLGLLRAWVEDGDPRHKWAAARAYAQVGLRYPREAMHQWRCILESEAHVTLRLTESFGIAIPHPLHMSVIDALLSLFLRAVEIPHRLRPVYEQALDGLAAWVEDDTADNASEQVGLPLFLALTTIRYPLESSSDPETWPPAMLRIVGTQPDSNYRRTLAELLRHTLRDPETRALAIEALQNWVHSADCDPWLAEVLTLLLQDLLHLSTASIKESSILKSRLRRWATHPRTPSAVAGQLYHKLFESQTGADA